MPVAPEIDEAAPVPAAPGDPQPALRAEAVHIDSLLLVDFTAGGNSAPYLTSGWGAPEARLAWTLGPRSGLTLPAPWDKRPRILELDVNPCRYLPYVTAQVLSVQVNGRFFGAHLLTKRTVLRCPLPPDVWEGRDTIEVVFEHPHFFVPRLLRQSADQRPLAVSFFSARLFSRHVVRPTVDLPELPPAAVPPLVLSEVPPPGPPLPAPSDAQASVYEFGVRRPGSDLVREGWSSPEPRFQWTDGLFAQLEVPAPATAGPYVLRMSCSAFTHGERLPAQQVSVILGGLLLGHLTVEGRATLALPLPADDGPWAEPLRIGLHLPTATRPSEIGVSSDSRRLGLAFHSIAIEPLPPHLTGWAARRVDEAAAPVLAPRVADRFCGVPDADLPAAVEAAFGLSPAALLRDFEGLGENCEFGIAQRKFDLEVLGLFRFGFTPLDSLLRGFADDFRAVADPEAVTVVTSDAKRPEFILAVDAYKMRWHTFVFANESDAEAVRRGHATKLGFVRRKFLESLRASRKIFVLKRERPLALAEVLPVLQEINRTGRNTLLYVVPGASPKRDGMVEWLGPGLLRGHIGAFAPYDDVMSVAAPDWLRLCANAWALRDHEPLVETAAVQASPWPPPEVQPAAAVAADAPAEEPAVARTVPGVADRFCAPSDEDLPAVVIAELGLTPAELLRDFESLGENCEFGIAQRKLDCEVLGLFRFGYADLPSLLRGFADSFASAADPGAVGISVSDGKRPEYIVSVAAYPMRWHTFVFADQAEAETTRRQQATKLAFLRRKFLEGLGASRKLFVLKRERALALEEALPVWEALNRHGRNTLMYVVPDAPPGRVGAVEVIRPGLLRGHIGAFAPNADVMSATKAEDWLRLCANAWTLRGAPDGPAAAPETAAAAQEVPERPPPSSPPEPDPALPSPAAMLQACESLGDTSAFGIVQRKLGADVLGLFRFADTPLPGLLAAFADEFRAIGDPASLVCSPDDSPRPQYVLTLPQYGMRWDSQVHADEADAESTRRRQAMKLGYLRRKFLESLRGPARLFVVRRDTPLDEDEVAPLAEALQRHGPHTLLYVVPGAGAWGEVTRVAPGVLRSSLPLAQAGAEAGAADADAWVRVIGNAWWAYRAHAETADAANPAGTLEAVP
jgi:hypothetical protein